MSTAQLALSGIERGHFIHVRSAHGKEISEALADLGPLRESLMMLQNRIRLHNDEYQLVGDRYLRLQSEIERCQGVMRRLNSAQEVRTLPVTWRTMKCSEPSSDYSLPDDQPLSCLRSCPPNLRPWQRCGRIWASSTRLLWPRAKAGCTAPTTCWKA